MIYSGFCKDCGTGVQGTIRCIPCESIYTLKNFATTPRTANVIGGSAASNLRKAQDFLFKSFWDFEYQSDTYVCTAGHTYGNKFIPANARIPYVDFIADPKKALEYWYGVGFMTWDEDQFTKKIDIDEILKNKEKVKSNYCFPHFWVKYTGLNEEFYFCKLCDERRKD